MPEVGPSFRDMTRVAGANPAIWADIFIATARRSPRRSRPPPRTAQRGCRADPRRRARGAWRLARGSRQGPPALLEAEPPAGPLSELRVVVANRPGTVAELALALGEAGVNIEDMALYPAPDMTSGAVSVWVGRGGAGRRAA